MKKNEELVIGQFNDVFAPLMDGVGIYAQNYSEELIKRGHKVYAVVGGADYKSNIHYDKQYGIDYTIRANTRALKSMQPYGITKIKFKEKQKLNKIKFDIIHTHCPTFLGYLGLRIAKKQNIPVVSTFHTQFKQDLKNKLKFDWLVNLVTWNTMRYYYKVDEVWTPSEKTKQTIINEYGFKGKIRVVSSAGDLIAPDANELKKLQENGYKISKTDGSVPLLVYIGQHKKEKNVELTLEALKILKDKGVAFKMLFIGEGPLMESMKDFCEKNNLNDNVTFLGLLTDRIQIKSIYSITDLILFPSLYDTSSLIQREGAALNVPLLFIKDSVTAELITDNVNGFLTQNNVEDYSNRIIEIIQDRDLLKKVGQGAYDTLYYTWAQVAEKIEVLYKEMIDKYNEQNS